MTTLVRAIVLGAICATFTAILNAYLHGPLDPVTVWTLVTAGYLVGAADGDVAVVA